MTADDENEEDDEDENYYQGVGGYDMWVEWDEGGGGTL